MSGITRSLARSSARHPWRTILVWTFSFVLAGLLSSRLLGGSLTTESQFTNNPESKRASSLLAEWRGPEVDTEFVVVTARSTVADPTYRTFVRTLRDTIEALGPGVVRHVGSYLDGDGPVSASGRSTLLPITIAGTDHAAVTRNANAVADAVREVPAPAGFQVAFGGPAALENDLLDLAQRGLQRGETVGIAVGLAVLVLVFGAVVAALIPIVLAVMAIAIALGAAAVIGQVLDLSFFITNIVTMIGLAVGIDYSLLIVSRFREERAGGRDSVEVIARADATASRAVFVSGLTVVVALTGLLMIPDTGFRSIGIGAILVVVIAVLASLTLLPAVLALLGGRVDLLRIRRKRSVSRRRPGRVWDRISTTVTRRPGLSLALAGGIMVVAALPFFSMRSGFSGVSTLPNDVASKRAFLVMEHEFSGGLGSPVQVVVDGHVTRRVMAAIGELRAALRADVSFGPSTLDTDRAHDVALVSVSLAGDIASDESMDAVRRLRTDLIPRVFARVPVRVVVGGATATNVDILHQQSVSTPLVFLFVLGLSFVLLTVAFRSLVVAVKAIAMNLLSVGATYGVLVLFFQRGTGPGFVKEVAGWLGFGQVEGIEAYLPLFLFTVLFGLSMDYHVFLLSRIRERYDRTGDNGDAVAHGLRSTGAMITGAAAIMVAVFAGFAAGPLVGLQQMGFGLAVALAIDATVVRCVLVPATMRLLGDRNWYLPSWLRWLPKVELDSDSEPAVPGPEAPARDLVGVSAG